MAVRPLPRGPCPATCSRLNRPVVYIDRFPWTTHDPNVDWTIRSIMRSEGDVQAESSCKCRRAEQFIVERPGARFGLSRRRSRVRVPSLPVCLTQSDRSARRRHRDEGARRLDGQSRCQPDTQCGRGRRRDHRPAGADQRALARRETSTWTRSRSSPRRLGASLGGPRCGPPPSSTESLLAAL
jgi:hypothetical protein